MKVRRIIFSLLIWFPVIAHAAGAWVQTATNASNAAYVNISPAAGDAVLIQSLTTSGGGSPTVTAIQAMSGAGGTGSVLATGTIPSALATVPEIDYYVTGGYILNLPSGVASILLTYNGGTPGGTDISVVEVSGVAASGAFISGVQQGQNKPGTTANSITSGSVSVGTAPAYIVGINLDDNTNTGTYVVAGTGFTGHGNVAASFVEDQTQASTGSYAATFTDATRGAQDEYLSTIFALKAARNPQSTNSNMFFVDAGINTLNQSPQVSP